MADVTLVLKADNSQYVNSIKQAQQASQKLYDSVSANMKEEKGLIGEVSSKIKEYNKLKTEAYKEQDIIKYTQKLQELEKEYERLNSLGKEVKKETDSIVASFGKWITSIGIVTTLMSKLKESFLDTRQGMLLFNQAGAAVSQVLYNMVNGIGDWNQGVAQAIILSKQKTLSTMEDLIQMKKAKQAMIEYNKLYTEGIDATITSEEKVKKLKEAKDKYIEATKIEIAITEKNLELAQKAFDLQPTSTKAMQEVAKLTFLKMDLEAELDSGTRRLIRQITATEKQIEQDWINAFEDRYKLALDLIDKRAKAETEAERAILDQQIKDQQHAMDLIISMRKEEAEKRKEIVKNSGSSLLDLIRYQTADAEKIIVDSLEDVDEKMKKFSDEELEDIEGKVAAVQDMMGRVVEFYKKFADLRQQEAQRNRELLDTQISETQDAIDAEIQLKVAGYASNVNAKKKELEDLKKRREEALRKEEEVMLKQRRLEAISQAINLSTSVSNILKAFTKFGPIGLALSSIAIAALFTMFNSAKTKATESTGFAKGGWTGNGFYRDETGERVAGTVHEREFVIRRGPAHKFRDVLEAINRDDRKMIFNKFNKLSPDLGGTTVNNVVVENNGPNKRLDQINRELRQLNKKQVKEEVMTSGNAVIIKKGDAMRIIKR